VRRSCTRSTYENAGERKIQSTTSTSGRTILRQKEYYLSASQARPMLTTVVVRSGLASVTHDETQVKSSCFQILGSGDAERCFKYWKDARSPKRTRLTPERSKKQSTLMVHHSQMNADAEKAALKMNSMKQLVIGHLNSTTWKRRISFLWGTTSLGAKLKPH